jgi:hypothetical protein
MAAAADMLPGRDVLVDGDDEGVDRVRSYSFPPSESLFLPGFRLSARTVSASHTIKHALDKLFAA